MFWSSFAVAYIKKVLSLSPLYPSDKDLKKVQGPNLNAILCAKLRLPLSPTALNSTARVWCKRCLVQKLPGVEGVRCKKCLVLEVLV